MLVKDLPKLTKEKDLFFRLRFLRSIVFMPTNVNGFYTNLLSRNNNHGSSASYSLGDSFSEVSFTSEFFR